MKLDDLSAKYESRGDAGMVSTGAGDHGGRSFGVFQMTQKTVYEFMEYLPPVMRAKYFGEHTPKSEDFADIWRNAAKAHRDEFTAYQYEFIEHSHYRPMKEMLLKHIVGVAAKSLASRAMNCVIWSTAVQHGGASRICLETAAFPTAEWIRAIYAERGRENDGVLVHFRSSSARVQAGVRKRFIHECRDALEMLEKENT